MAGEVGVGGVTEKMAEEPLGEATKPGKNHRQ